MYERARVILPKWCWDNTKNKQDLKNNISQYLRRYPGYKVIKIGKYYAICEIGR